MYIVQYTDCDRSPGVLERAAQVIRSSNDFNSVCQVVEACR